MSKGGRLHYSIPAAFLAVTMATAAFGQGSVVVRIEDPSGSHCIDATSEDVTIHIRRIFVEKAAGFFTEDQRAGVLLSARLTGRSKGGMVDVQVPSVTLVSIANDRPGRTSLPLEYQIASYLSLNQGDIVTTGITIDISLARTRGRNSFGELLDLAGKALGKISIPSNPYSELSNKFLPFANATITDVTAKQLDAPFAQLALAFGKGKEPILDRCRAAGRERTGAIAVLSSRGTAGTVLIPVTDTGQHYCFRYSRESTYELLAAPKLDGQCPALETAYSAVNNDYVMFLISALPSASGFLTQQDQQRTMEEARTRCAAFGLEPKACGLPEH
jgi:hypothetical protein